MTLFNAACPPGEHRNAPRYPIRSVVSLVLGNGAVVSGRLFDMSVGGAFLQTPERPFGLEAGEEGMLGLRGPVGSPDGSHRFACEVIRVDRDGVALRFLAAGSPGKQEGGSGRQWMPDDFLDS